MWSRFSFKTILIQIGFFSVVFFSSVDSFGQQIILNQPYNNSYLKDSLISFSWQIKNVITDSSILKIYTNKKAKSIVLSDNINFQKEKIISNGVYFWKVFSYSQGQIDSSIKFKFTRLNLDSVKNSFFNFSPTNVREVGGKVYSISNSIKSFSDSLNQVSISKRPVLVTKDSLINFKIVQFDGKSNSIRSDRFNLSKPFNYFYLAKLDSITSFQYLFDGGCNACFPIMAASSNPNYIFRGGGVNVFSNIPADTSNYQLINIELNQDTAYLFLNGIFYFKGPIGASVNTLGLTLGSIAHTNASYSKQKFVQITAIDSLISDSLRSEISNFLLSSNHFSTYIPQKIYPNNLCHHKISLPKMYRNIIWNNGNTSNSNSYNKSGKYFVSYTNHFGVQFVDSFQIEFPLKIPPNDSLICFGSSVFWEASHIPSFSYSWSTGSTDSALTISQPGDYWVQVTDSFGCSITSDTVHIEVDSFAVQASLGADKNLCQGNQLELETGRGDAENYLWNTGDTTSQITINNAGTYTLFAESANGCSINDTITIGIKGLAPTPKFSFQNICFGDSANFIDSSLANSGAINQWIWNFGDGTSDSIQNPSHLYQSPGKYEVSLLVLTDSGCESISRDSILIYSNPTPDFATNLLCENLETQFSDSSSPSYFPLTHWQFKFGDGDTSSSRNPIHIFYSTQTYQTKLIVTDSMGCKDSIEKSIFIKPSPLTNFSITQPCESDTSTLVNQSIADSAISVNWTLWDSTSLSGETFPYLFDSSGFYSIFLEVTDSNNCFDTITKLIFIRENPTIISQLPDTTICLYDSIAWNINFPSNHYTFLWQDSSSNSSLNIDSAGTYFYEVTDSLGCNTTSNPATISINYFEEIASLGNDTSLCAGNKIELQVGGNEAVLFNWSSADTTSQIAVFASGIYSVTTTNNLGCEANDTININIKGLAPNASISFQNVCNGNSVNFLDQSTSNSGNISSWLWSFGNGQTSSSQNPVYSYSDSGKYEITFSVFTDSGCVSTLKDSILIYPNPVANYYTSLSCERLNTNFIDSSISFWNLPITYKYYFGNGDSSTIANPTFNYDSSKSYTTSLFVESSIGCKDSISKTLFVKPSPIADFTYSSPCVNDSVLIQQNATGVGSLNYQWTLWNGFAFSGNSFSNVFTTIGSYQLSLQVTDTNNCFDTITKNIPIRNHPQILNQLNDTIICLFDTLTWNVPYPKNHFSFLWQDGSTDSLFHLDSAGTYLYQVTDSVGCSSTSQSIQVSVNNFPSLVTLGNDTSLCKGELVSLKNNQVYLTQTLWSTGDTTTTIAIDSTSNYSVTLTDTMGCIGSDTFNVLVRGEAALVKLAYDTTCILDSTQFYDISILAAGDTIINWEWNFGNNLIDSIQNPKTYYPASGFYPIHLKAFTNDFCFSETFDTIQVYNLPSPNFSSQLACDNREVIFTDNSTAGDGVISNWNWSFGDANNTKSNLQNPVFTYDTSGNFSVSLEVINSFGCSNLTAQNKKVEFTPRAKFETDNVCEGELAQFSSTSFIEVSSFYVWDFGDSIQSQGVKVQHLYDTINSYQVRLIVNSQNGCSDTAFSVLEVFQNPEAKTFTGIFCKNETFAIEDTSSNFPYPISNYTWKLNNVEIDTGKFLNFSLNDTGSYDFELIITNSVGCSDSIIGAIKIDGFPIANFDYAPTFGAAPIIVDFFNQSSQFFNNVWKMNDSTFSTSKESEFNFEENGNYNIKLINTNSTGCADSITKSIKILPPILDISINNLSYEVVENSFLKSSFEVSNLGTRTINYFEILAETQSGQKLKEIFELTIQPGETIPLSLKSQLQLPENNQFGYLCLEAFNPENEGIDDNPLNNKVCLSQESFVVKNIFPNPSANNVNIGFIVGEVDQVTIEIFNSNGKEIKLLYSGNTVIGLNTFTLNVENLDAGLYVARYTFKGEQKTQNFVVTK